VTRGAARRLAALQPAAGRLPVSRLAAGRLRATAITVLLAALAVLPAASCGAAQPGPYRATVSSCFAFGVRAIEQRLTVTELPRACAGLSHEQVNLALARALRAAVGPRPKAAARRAAERESKYLGDLFAAVPPPRPEPATVTPQQSASRPLQFAALGAWLATATAGSYLLVGWIAAARRRKPRHAARPPAVLIAHAGLAIAGLGIWTAFLAAGAVVLAWLAIAMILLVAGLGMATLVTGLPEPQSAGARSARPTAQVLVIGAHGALATVAILLVLLAAIGAG
jgi:hypothetical protein